MLRLQHVQNGDMGNDYFSFKEFTVRQGNCAMKVCTDACIQGAGTALKFKQVKNILDIGTGTGLLSLMLAQKTNANITAVEMDKNAFTQAAENFSCSPWGKRLSIHHADIKEFYSSVKYDGIICNPPFYKGDLHSPDEMRNAAMHGTTLTLEILLTKIKDLLAEGGLVSVMIPFRRYSEFEKLLSNNGFHILNVLSIRQTGNSEPFRSIFLFSNQNVVRSEEELIIREQGEYSKDFIELLKEYYLKL